LNSLIEGLLSYKLTENLSIVKASEWLNRTEVLETFGIQGFEQKTLYRVLSILGENREEIMMSLQDRLFETYDFEHTNINMDWTSIVLHGEKCPIAKYGYSRDHRPDKKQITVGVSELATPINVPIGMTVREGNVNDQVHFTDTFDQVIGRLSEGSLVVFDQGANRKANLERIEARKMKYVTARQLNKSDDATWIKFFDKTKAELVDASDRIYGLKKEFPKRTNHLYFSEKLYYEHMESKLRKVERLFNEAELIQKSLEKNRRLPKRYRINNPLIDCEYSYQTKLAMIDENHAKEILKKACITGREGFFCIVSNIDLTLPEALRIYRQKNSIEMIFDSLKNEIEIKPLRVWTDISIYGALIIGFIAQLIMSLIRFEHQELKHTSVKFIKYSLMNLTVTIEKVKHGLRRVIYSNFDSISSHVLGIKAGIG
jgi:transposase